MPSRILVGDKEMVVWWSMKAGVHAAAHQHPHEQMFVVMRARPVRPGTRWRSRSGRSVHPTPRVCPGASVHLIRSA